MHQFDFLEPEGELSRLRRLQRGDQAPRDWCPPGTQWDRVGAWHLEVARVGDQIIRQGPSTEDKGFQEHLIDARTPLNWNDVGRSRIELAQHVATELTHDPGLSDTFFRKLFNHLVSLLLPCPAHRYGAGGALDLRPRGESITAQMVHNFDCA